MKLTDITLNEVGVCQNINFPQLENGLNVIYGENGTGKSTLRRYVRGVLFGFDADTWKELVTSNIASGQIGLANRSGNAIATRGFHGQANLELTGIKGSTPQTIASALGAIGSSTFDAFFNVDLQNAKDQAVSAAIQMKSALGVPAGINRWASEAEYQTWKAQANSRQTQFDALQAELNRASQEQQSLKRELSAWQSQLDSRRQFESEIASLTQRINQLKQHLQTLQTQAAKLDSELASLRPQLNVISAVAPALTVPTVATESDRLIALYERLDQAESQIVRWRKIQTDVQNQRIRLRDEMVIWNEMTLDSHEHPYHRSQEILIRMESKVDDIENQAQVIETSYSAADSARTLVGLCGSIREDLYALCQELGSQYKSIRHKAAVAELKQLRRCYNEMGENIDRLVERRQTTLHEIRALDPAGAEAIVRADNQFCECARHQGYLEARRRFVGGIPAAAIPVTQPTPITQVQTENPAIRQRINESELARSNVAAEIAHVQAELLPLETRLRNLSQSQNTPAHLNDSNLQSRLVDVENRLATINRELTPLTITIEQDRLLVGTAPNPVIALASRYLNQISEGDLTSVWLSNDRNGIQITDRRGNTIAYPNLGPGEQHTVTLALCVASAVSSKVELPVLIDDIFGNVDNSTAIAIANWIASLCSSGIQVIAFTCRRSTLDHVVRSNPNWNVVFEMPQTGVSPAPIVTPERSPVIIPVESPNIQQRLAPEPAIPFNDSPALRTYPYLKYPVVGHVTSTQASHVEPNYQSNLYVQPEAPRAIQSPSPVLTATTSARTSATTVMTEATAIAQTGLVDPAIGQRLQSWGVHTFANLLDLDPDRLPVPFNEHGVSAEQVDRWQAQAWMVICVPGMAISDSRLLVASGVKEPEQIDTTPYDQLVARVSRFLQSDSGRREFSNYSLDRARFDRWYDSLRSTRSDWRRDSGYSRRYRRGRATRNPREYDRQAASRSFAADRSEHSQRRLHERAPQDRTPRERTPRQPRSSRTEHEPRRERTPRERTQRERTPREPRVNQSDAQLRSQTVEQENVQKLSSSKKKKKQTLKFYLELTDHIEAAPSIGPRTAERFEKIGVVTIAEFLRQTAESMAKKINYKRINANVVRQWQQQSRLMCRIPNLRGHDAQLLVACEMTDPDELATMNPEKVYSIVAPFSETKEGLKIIRSGKKPDLQEVTDWIDWATNNRTLQAA